MLRSGSHKISVEFKAPASIGGQCIRTLAVWMGVGDHDIPGSASVVSDTRHCLTLSNKNQL